jgi:uncharacterized membrane protein YfhO
VLVDAYDPGWKATVDGTGFPILRANTVFRAVAMEPGAHRVEQRYRPASVKIGMLISSTAFVLGIAALLMRRSPRD